MTDRIDDASFDDDLAAKFARLDRLDAPDNWDRAEALAGASVGASRSMQRWWAVAAAVALVFGGVIGVAATRGGDTPPQNDSTSVAPVTSTAESVVSEPSTDAEGGVDMTLFGSATVEPARAAPGDLVTVSPNGVIQPTCTDLGAIFAMEGRAGTPLRLGILGDVVTWTPESTQLTIPACLPAETDEPMTYLIPDGLPVGIVSICRAIEFADAACGPLEIVEGSDVADTIEVPVVEGLTEGEAVRTLRSLELIVLVERVEVQPGDPNAGRVVSQNPVAATLVQVGDQVAIVIGTAVDTANDELAQALIRFGVDLAMAPADAATLDGATFCGTEQLGPDGFPSDAVDVTGRRCLLDHHAARLPAVFVSARSTVEGDPIVVVTRTHSDGTASEFVDSTRDTFGSGEWRVEGCGLPKGLSDSSLAFGCADGAEPLTEPIIIESLAFPDWFARRTPASSCGYFSARLDGSGDTGVATDNERPLECMAEAIGSGDAAELVTVHVGEDLRVARWIVSVGSNTEGTPQFEVASLVVDLRAGTTRWAETRCVEGELVGGRLVGDFIVDREFVDQLDPSGTIVTDNGDVLIEPGPDERGQLQPCNGSQRVERPDVTPFEATGLRIGDIGGPIDRFLGWNEMGEYDITIAPSWNPVAMSNEPGIIGFSPSDSLEFPPPPDEPQPVDDSLVIYADDGVTRIGEFRDGGAVLD